VLASEAADRIADLVCPGVAFDREDARLALAPCASIADAVDSRETANLALVARAMTEAALRREESCGAHHRLDFPYSRPESCRHQRFALDAHRPRGLVETAGAAFDEVRS
jgi:L-aspartate oxidase